MIDLDGFKLINDQHGHADGDRVLRNVAAMLKLTVRTNDVVARYGGDEFVILMPDTDEDAARLVADRVVKGIRGQVHALDGRCGGARRRAPWAWPSTPPTAARRRRCSRPPTPRCTASSAPAARAWAGCGPAPRRPRAAHLRPGLIVGVPRTARDAPGAAARLLCARKVPAPSPCPACHAPAAIIGGTGPVADPSAARVPDTSDGSATPSGRSTRTRDGPSPLLGPSLVSGPCRRCRGADQSAVADRGQTPRRRRPRRALT